MTTSLLPPIRPLEMHLLSTLEMKAKLSPRSAIAASAWCSTCRSEKAERLSPLGLRTTRARAFLDARRLSLAVRNVHASSRELALCSDRPDVVTTPRHEIPNPSLKPAANNRMKE